MEQQPQLNVDLTKTQPILTPSGGKVWQAGFLLRKVNRFLTGGDKDMLVPVQVFFDPESGEICKEGLPENFQSLLDEGEISKENLELGD